MECIPAVTLFVRVAFDTTGLSITGAVRIGVQLLVAGGTRSPDVTAPPVGDGQGAKSQLGPPRPTEEPSGQVLASCVQAV